MKKILVVIAILAAAAACGGSQAPSLALHEGSAPVPAAQPGKVGSAPGATVPGTSDAGPNQPTVVPAPGPQVIKQAQVSLSVKSGTFDSSLAAVRGLVEGEQGFIAGTDAQANPGTDDQIRSGVISFMVPSANFDATIDALNKLGQVQSEHITGQDVSAQYVDLQARLANEEAQRNAMLALLAQAKSINDIITVQNQIGQITQQIEQLKGQIQYLDHNTAYSTIAVTLTEAGAPAPATTADTWGFATALSDAAHNFVTTINYVVSGLGAIGPVLVLVGLVYLVWRRRGSPGLRRA